MAVLCSETVMSCLAALERASVLTIHYHYFLEKSCFGILELGFAWLFLRIGPTCRDLVIRLVTELIALGANISKHLDGWSVHMGLGAPSFKNMAYWLANNLKLDDEK
jgi:hypothetical protein